MIDRYIQLNRALRSVSVRVRDLEDADRYSDDGFAPATLWGYVLRDVTDLERLWPSELSASSVRQLREVASRKEAASYRKILDECLPEVENVLDSYFGSQPSGDLKASLLDLLHPTIIESSYSQFRGGQYRDAVFNAFVAVFELLRTRTGLDKDGTDLAASAFSLTTPRLVLSSLTTESGRNDQKGFMQLLQGAFLGIRNPKAHSLASDLVELSAAQYLVFASLLARRVAQAELAISETDPV